MNAARRKAIKSVISQIEAIQFELENILEAIDTIRDEEQECFDNIPENMQESERYEKAETAVENLDDAYDSFGELCDSLEDIITSLENATD